ncbi:flagellar basal-body rod protein FlgG [Pseudohongiella sp. SYSU M77423]|uniref:flagellar basal-body rod protein FlgG n=1 Tax=unclassified Pseudohongiella TaxID=2629611 RepID=UPI000C41C277|nr:MULTISPECIES: flagellar basal-body rod protein FlgG [unclassified Pseudohongiella]MAY56042.1 flagellar basal body rod protein FlgG [Gammaproteobacteria bacterium]MBJ54823.1 flagellar basal body rod protein FlgG [Gammaproteobacteria bacterium]MDH7944879.1 flagellar basal-body rod protein FlgG [Pseudohongiella sp. SYSU M77423]HBN13695.1 flagellar basal body rod protein FlgG [Pseudohongiella sp.]|tara:strand:+ start:396 stop:1181 length:786 start_codon:yes stop_codon:yes gene_type:complete
MHAALYVSKTGLSAQDTRLATVSNNLANVATNGFKKDRVVFEDLLYQIQRQPGANSTQNTELPSGLQIGTGVKVAGTQKLFSQGSLQTTGESLDVGINGRGFFEVIMPDGSSSYTRDGQFHMNGNGELVTSQGFLVAPGITIPQDAQSLTIGDDGVISVRLPGQATTSNIGNMNLVDFVNPAGLQALGGNLYAETVSSGNPQQAAPGQNGMGTLEQGSLESSNVEVVEELVDMITTQRAYEMNSKVISTADQMLQFVTQNL